jgi:adenosine deaminase
MDRTLEDFVRGMPKAELHLHIEGTLEPEMLFALARRNRAEIPFASLEDVRAAYRFADLQSFLDVYYQGMRVLQTERDFFDLTWAYLQRARHDNVRRAEIFFDPQAHTARGIPFETVIRGIGRALARGREELGVSSGLILCFLRHLPPEQALATLEEALPFADRLIGVGLDSSEIGHPPEGFVEVFARAREAGLRAVAHAGEEGPPEYIWQALELLEVERVDHGVRALEDGALVERLAGERIPLTVCPLSNVELRVFETLAEHNLKELLAAGLCASLHSDDPAYFGGYVGDNFVAAARALGLERAALQQLAANGIEAAFLPAAEKRALLDELEGYVAGR